MFLLKSVSTFSPSAALGFAKLEAKLTHSETETQQPRATKQRGKHEGESMNRVEFI
jgi:hypothetical protein